MAITNFTKFFAEERDILVQNISNCNVVVQFDVGNGHVEPFTFNNTKDPVNLTQFIPFTAIKGSMDFRKMLNRTPPALQLLTKEEHDRYFENLKSKLGLKSVDEAFNLAEERRNAYMERRPLPDAPDPIKLHEVVEDDQLGRKVVKPLESVSVAEEINPRVLNLCLQVHPQVPEPQKMTAQQFLTEVDTIDGLTLTDWAYIQDNGTYKTVKNFAKKKLAELAARSDE